MQIVRLTAENVKRINAVDITPDPTGAMVVVGGKNAQGKSSVLDAIAMALGGKGTFGPRPVHEGADRATIVVELDDLVVTRIINTNNNSSLVVASKDGARYTSPQAMLDKLVGRLTFDPLAFVNLGARQQVEALRGLVGLDFTALDKQRAELYEERTGVNRDLRRAQDQASAMPHYTEAPAEPLDALDLMNRREDILKHNREQEQRALAIHDAQEDVDRLSAKIAEVENLLAALRVQLADQKRRLGDLLVPEPMQSTADVEAEIASLKDTNAKVAANKHRAEALAVAEKIKETAAGLTSQIEALDRQKAAVLAGAKFPVAGLGFDENGITFNGLPFVQASSAEQLRVSVAMGLAMNPTIKVLLIRDGSLLDEDNLRLVAELAAEAGGQVWVERVSSDGQGCQVVIEDGQVKGGA